MLDLLNKWLVPLQVFDEVLTEQADVGSSLNDTACTLSARKHFLQDKNVAEMCSFYGTLASFMSIMLLNI